MLLELAIGDAYGAGFEYASPGFVRRRNDLSRYVEHPWHSLEPGCYTDDTQMSIALAELLLSEKPWTHENIADHFVHAFKRDKRKGYSNRFYDFLCSIETGSQFLDEVQRDSSKNGAAMRSVPIGLLAETDRVIEYATIQAEITHNSREGTGASVAVALMAHYFIHQLGRKSDLGYFLGEHIPRRWNDQYRGKVGPDAFECVHAALTAIMTSDSLSSLLVRCVNYTGDVDTIAAIALGSASCCSEIEKDLPEPLIARLEDGRYGRKYLSELDRQLAPLCPNG